MKQESLYFTAGQFARLHQINKRTLHYYDDIGLFSPAHKGENGYRYYTYRQSAELENILALRELGMSIEEIKDYTSSPGAGAFLLLAAQKTRELDQQIKRLGQLKAILRNKQRALAFCSELADGTITITRYPKRQFLLTPLVFSGTALSEMGHVMAHLQIAWESSAFKTGCGSYIGLDKVRRGEFTQYDGLFTVIDKPKKGVECTVMPSGEYLCGYCIGRWDRIPALYQSMLEFAAAEKVELSGNCYELGLNEFAVSSPDHYVTQIQIPCKPKDMGVSSAD